MSIECLKGGELYFNMSRVGRYPPFVAHWFFKQAVSAIGFMNQKEFCHRDLKPWNIMLTDDLS